MRFVLAFALCLASATVQAQASGDAAVKNLPMASAKPARPAQEEPARKSFASLAFTATDDADSVLLPAFASRSTPQPMRFLRVGLEWSF